MGHCGLEPVPLETANEEARGFKRDLLSNNPQEGNPFSVDRDVEWAFAL